jgi:hypothetical protein
VPKTLTVCHQPQNLWNATFIQQVDGEVNQVTLSPDGTTIEIKSSTARIADLKCFTGEPDLEKLMSNGNEINLQLD